MNVILLNKTGSQAKNISLSTTTLWSLFIFVSLSFSSLVFSIYQLNQPQTLQQLSETLTPDLEGEDQLLALLQLQGQEITQTGLKAKSQVEALSLRVAKMQAQMIRMEQLGQKLVKVAKLSKKEFDFSTTPAMGGPNVANLPDVEGRIASVLAELENKESQLAVIETLIEQRIQKNLQNPRGKPAEKGWISSYFGRRKDPFSGKRAMHNGIDVAGKEGAKIIATAEGIVTWAEERSGYGNLIEIEHGNGLITRYGHCQSIAVKVGQQIKQGDSLGTIGSTGRSTGPHIHYEVIKNGVKINPMKYVRLSRLASNLN